MSEGPSPTTSPNCGSSLIPLDKSDKVTFLKMRFEDHVNTLRYMRDSDFKVIFGYMAMQLAIAGFLLKEGLPNYKAFFGVVVFEFSMMGVILHVFRQRYSRREDVIKGLWNVRKALGFLDADVYLVGLPLEESSRFKPGEHEMFQKGARAIEPATTSHQKEPRTRAWHSAFAIATVATGLATLLIAYSRLP